MTASTPAPNKEWPIPPRSKETGLPGPVSVTSFVDGRHDFIA
jgi:hypothetical protein